MESGLMELVRLTGNDRSELDGVITYELGEGASEEAMSALRGALLKVDNDPTRLSPETLKMLVRIARQTDSSTRGMMFNIAV